MTGLASVLRVAANGLHHARLSRPLSLAIGYARRKATFPILSFHRINDEADPFFPSMATEVFARQMEFVARAYVVLTVEELADRMRRNALPRNALAITFDDGYRDNLTHAAPILARHGLPATVFVVTGSIETGEPLWFDRLALAFRSTRVTTWTAPWGQCLPLDSTTERLGALAETLRQFKRLTGAERRDGVERVLDALGTTDERALGKPMLTWRDAQALVGLNIAIGGHTVTHPILSYLTPAEARAEIAGSFEMIRAACGRRPQAFAYPNGRPEDYSMAIAGMVRDAGFTCAVTTRFGVNSAVTPPYELRRGGPWEQDLPTFALKLAGYRLSEA